MISAIVLAAGASTRLGRPKQLLELEGHPLLQHVVDAAVDAGMDEVVVVLGHESDLIAEALTLPPNARIVVNTAHGQGQSTSLVVGLDSIKPDAEAAVILLGDQPRLNSSVIKKVVDVFRTGGSPVVRTLWRGTPGHPVVVAASEWGRFRTVKGDKGARDLIADSALTQEVEIGDPPLTDVDTWEDYETILINRR